MLTFVVFAQGEQRWRELRSLIGATGILAVENHFVKKDKMTNAERKSEAKFLLNKNIYIYGKVEKKLNGVGK